MGIVRQGRVARHATPQRLGFPPGWPRPQFPGLCHLPLRLGAGGLRGGTPRPLAQGNESNDGRSGRATGGQGLVWRIGRDCASLGGVQGKQMTAALGQEGRKQGEGRGKKDRDASRERGRKE